MGVLNICLPNRPAAAPPPRFLFSCIRFHEAAAPTVLSHLGCASVLALAHGTRSESSIAMVAVSALLLGAADSVLRRPRDVLVHNQ